MTTSAFEITSGISDRLSEVNEIVVRAEDAFDKDESFYDILCRSGCVLMVSALEGFIKDLISAIQSDFQINIPLFAGMPKNIKRAFGEKIVFFENVPESEIQKRVTQLVKFFDVNSVKIDMTAFQYKENTNKNPSANMIDGSFSKFGINSILHALSDTKFEAVFDNDHLTNMILRREIRRMRSHLYRFPYRAVSSTFVGKDWVVTTSQAMPVSMWQTFLENILRRRNAVVHADTKDNPTSWQTMKEDIAKLEVLFFAVTFAATSLITSQMK